MPKEHRPDRSLIAARILAFVCVVLALMCAGLAWAWNDQRQEAACWRVAAEFQRPDGACHG